MIEQHLPWLPSFVQNRTLSPIEHTALLWRCVYEVVEHYQKELRGNENFLFMTHESFCRNPAGSFREVYRWGELDLNSLEQRYLDDLTASHNPTMRTSEHTHQYKMKRDSKGIVRVGTGTELH